MSPPTQLRMLSNGTPLRSNSETQHHEKRKTDAMGSLSVPSWNQVQGWLKEMDTLRKATELTA